MFNVGPLELLVLAMVGLIVLGPDKLPGMARDAARMLRTLRELATNARTQLRDELGPEFADVDLRNLNPRTAISRVILGEDAEAVRRFDPATAMRNVILGDDDPVTARPAAGADPGVKPVSMQKPATVSRPLGADEPAPFDADAT